jgi:hypothetical protein
MASIAAVKLRRVVIIVILSGSPMLAGGALRRAFST